MLVNFIIYGELTKINISVILCVIAVLSSCSIEILFQLNVKCDHFEGMVIYRCAAFMKMQENKCIYCALTIVLLNQSGLEHLLLN